KGVSLSKMGDEKGAIELYDRALAIKPDDYDALRNKGASLSKMGDEKGAIELYDRALAIKPDDCDALRNKGVSLSKMGDEKGAIELYDRALAIKPDDSLTIREWAVVAFNMGDHAAARNKIKRAAELDPEKYQTDFRTIMRLTDKDPDREWQDLFSEKPEISAKPVDELQEIRDFVGTIRKNLGETGQKFLRQKEEAENNVKMFLQPESLLASDRSFFLVLRKWNSYTPAIPTDDDERSRGGGYFLYYNGKGTVIDPGYNFIENFHQAGCRIHDINSIIITHAHNDHTIDFESICTLLHQYNRGADKKPGVPKKKISLYFNNGAFKKFSGLLNLMDKNFEPLHTLNVGNEYQITAGMQLTVLSAFHDEVVSRDQSIGLLFTMQCGENKRKIVFTSDTGLFPLCTEADEPKPDTSHGVLSKAYPVPALENPDLLVVHIGSIKKEELEHDLNEDIGKCLYPNHLGLIGCAWMITKLRPKLALVSEFGEEMRLFRKAIVERIELDVVHKVIKDEPKSRVAPADLAFIYDIAEGKFLCCAHDTWTDVAEIDYDYDDDNTKENIYYFSKKNLNEIGKSAYAHKINEFRQRRKERKGMYFGQILNSVPPP
ncbi:MAG: tetratricopeptide repeat protein, partial [Pelobacteraceae bacterium]